MITKDELKKLLKETVITVKFKKKDDTIRTMVCTLSEDYLPEKKDKNENETVKADNPNTIPVWDVEKHAWRSFRLDSILEYETNQ